MTVSVAVVDPVPALRKGLVAALGEAGLRASEPDDVEDWLLKKGNRVVVLTMEAGAAADILRRLRDIRPDVVILALLRDSDHSEASYMAALKAGAAGTLALEATPSLIALATQAAIQNYGVVPAITLASLARMAAPAIQGLALKDTEIDWLRRLAKGETVTAIAASIGYSEREMHRLLRKVYRKMDVLSRTAALIKAARQGILN